MKLVITLISLFLVGCGTFFSRSFFDPYADGGGPATRIYSGTVFDVACLTADNIAFFCLIDLPFSMATDTLFLPVTIYEQFFTGQIHKAAVKGDLNKVDEMLSKGLNVDTKDVYGHTALMSAAWGGHNAVVKALLDRGADVNAKAKYDRTALMYAAARDYSDIVNTLLEKGGEVNSQDKEGNSALRLSILKGQTSTVKTLLDKEADPNEIGGKYKNTPLMEAAWRGYPSIVRALLEKGADPEIKGKDGRTALELAMKRGHEEIVQLLKNASRDKK